MEEGANLLFQRHAARRDLDLDRELEWDEQDNARRARALLQHIWANPPPDEVVDVDDHSERGSSDIEDAAIHDLSQSMPDRARGMRTSAGGLFGFPTYGGLLDEDSEEEEEDDPVFGFDGDGLERDIDEAMWAFGHEGYDNDMDGGLRRNGHPLAALWPGLLGERPLNPASARRRTAPPPVLAASQQPPIPSLHAAARAPQDPSSSTSYSSFLAPGATFTGQQTFGKSLSAAARALRAQGSARSSDDPPRRQAPAPPDGLSLYLVSNRDRSTSGESSSPGNAWYLAPSLLHSSPEYTTAHPTFAPFPAATATRVPPGPPDVGPSSSLAIPRPSSSSSSAFNPSADPSQAFLLGPLRPTSSGGTGDSQPSQLASRAFTSSRYAPYSAPSPSSSTSGAVPAPTSSSSTAVPPEASPVPSPPPVPIPPNLSASIQQVVIHSYSPSAAPLDHSHPFSTPALTGVMHALGVLSPSRNPSSSPLSRVTTYFSAHIIRPLLDGLFVSPSRTGSGNSPSEGLVRVSPYSEAESWVQLGPFRGMDKDELFTKGRDAQWVEEKTKGWVLMRWKERDFINVNGLYTDPASAPYQRLNLRPSSESGAFSLGTFGYR
ncbi:SPOSA6832_00394 [Sporobolomyces salmonicolor]|uniref:SPOSA6832_00394-mRNA-1:cds n=1 Tax=Sporidiobolus salmonicolor TaxID=5005 RepID=A0A0D6EFV5_SPOSA|nr:SPOSA6832_00394 [Sporobolomyces salmonicolor]